MRRLFFLVIILFSLVAGTSQAGNEIIATALGVQ